MSVTQVQTTGIENNAVTSAKIPNGAVGTTEIANDAVTAAKIATGAVGTTQIANDAVTAAKIATGAVGTTQIANDAVTTAKIANGAVGTTQIADNAVTPAKLSNPLTLETAKNATGSAVNFTGIPSWVKRITVMMNNVSTNGSSIPIIQLGDSGGIETTEYNSVCISVSAINNNITRNQISTVGIILGTDSNTAAAVITGNISINKISGNTWITTGNFTGASLAGNSVFTTTSTKTLSNTLTRLRITTTDTFDDGTINIMYE